MRQSYAWRMNLELRQLRALIAVVDEGTFTDAAIVLGCSQAAVSRAVAGLERALEVRLLDRTTRALALTTVGARVVEHARRALAETAAIAQVAATRHDELCLGFAWSALGAHTRTVQRRWSAAHPDVALRFVQSATESSGLIDGTAHVAIMRRPGTDARFHSEQVGAEARYAAMSDDDALARRRTVRLSDFAGRPIGIDFRTGTTVTGLWPTDARPSRVLETHGIDEWLTAVAAGQTLGLTSEATVRQYPRPGISYRRVVDAPEVPVLLTWRRHDPPPQLAELLTLVREAYAGTPTSTAR